ncbi:MAG: hypothetical protein J6U60_01490, partial [Clostridia bacterium]|nr:hypothetical protein [Clostridia bacterium]
LDRIKNTPLGAAIRLPLDLGAPVFNIGTKLFYVDANEQIIDMQNPPTGTPDQAYYMQAAGAMMAAMAEAKYIGLNQGGLSVLLELFPYSAS